MAKPAPLAEPQGPNHSPNENRDGVFNTPADAAPIPARPQAPRVEARSLRGTFAKSICSAHGLATRKDREACDDGVPCHCLSECMNQADATIRYLELRRALMTTDENH
ncbi:hypothetical protein [Magnetovibrio blakemorei]|uniref:Uncharacterized protein n=1 Tax=Magnetovibrio blakemorei TaxID=28181 RepID=A0A1E5Q9H5_9PROT|nr:hypothetical protein [Magnetovibrio blakemorei]OEJ68214.1 hypothetical protein BEN30_06735 [Magnetovibrio blakemorei]